MAKPQKILDLLTALEKETGLPLKGQGAASLAEKINTFNQIEEGEHAAALSPRWLTEKAKAAAEKAVKEGKEYIGTNEERLSNIARFLGYDSFADFGAEVSLPPQESSLLGTYVSYLRESSGLPYVLKTPVLITRAGDKLLLKTPRSMAGAEKQFFEGELLFANNCIHIAQLSQADKHFFRIYRLGNSIAPKVIKGIFCGTNTNGNPIAGVDILVKYDDEVLEGEAWNEFLTANKKRLTLEELLQSNTPHEPLIARYMEHFIATNMKLTEFSTYNIDDIATRDWERYYTPPKE